MYHDFLVVLAVILFFQPGYYGIYAQDVTIQSILWNVPDGELQDLSQTFTAGTTLALSWNEYDSTQYVDTTKNLVYLWVSSFDFNTNSYSKLLKRNVNMTQPGNFAWTIDIPDRFLAVSAKYVLRFKLPAESFDPGTGELSSPGFLVLRSIIETSTSASVSSSSSTISTTPSSISPATATPTQTNDLSKSQLTSSETSPGMGSGAKAGIGIGVAVGVIGIIAAS